MGEARKQRLTEYTKGIKWEKGKHPRVQNLKLGGENINPSQNGGGGKEWRRKREPAQTTWRCLISRRSSLLQNNFNELDSYEFYD